MDNWLFDNVFILILAALSAFEMLQRGSRLVMQKRIAQPQRASLRRREQH